MACLIPLKDLLASIVYFISFSFFSMLVIVFKISTKLGMGLLKKITLSWNDWISLVFLGIQIFWIASTLYESIFIPSLEIICPKIFPSFMVKKYFLGLNICQNFCILERFVLNASSVHHLILKIRSCLQ